MTCGLLGLWAMTSGRSFSFSIFSFGDLSFAVDSDVAFPMPLRMTFPG